MKINAVSNQNFGIKLSKNAEKTLLSKKSEKYFNEDMSKAIEDIKSYATDNITLEKAKIKTQYFEENGVFKGEWEDFLHLDFKILNHKEHVKAPLQGKIQKYYTDIGNLIAVAADIATEKAIQKELKVAYHKNCFDEKKDTLKFLLEGSRANVQKIANDVAIEEKKKTMPRSHRSFLLF